MATRGRPAFQPTDEQRINVEIMVGLGIPEEKICLLIRNRRDKPICRNTLRRHFEKELQTAATKLNAKVGHFMVATIFGTRPPEGVTPIRDERVRGRLGELYLKARLGWREDRNRHKGREEGPGKLIQDVRRRVFAKIARLAEPPCGEISIPDSNTAKKNKDVNKSTTADGEGTGISNPSPSGGESSER